MCCENRFLSVVYVTTLNTLKKYFIGEILVQSSNEETGTMVMNGIPIYCYIQCMYPWLMKCFDNYLSICLCRSSRPEVFCKKGVLRNFAFTGKHLCQSLFF